MLTIPQLRNSALDTRTGAIAAAVTAVVASALLLRWASQSARPKTKTRDGIAAKEPHTLPTCKPIVGDTLELLKNIDVMHDWMVDLGRQFSGDAYSLSLLGRPKAAVLYTPQQIEDVLKNEFDAFPKGPYMAGNMRDVLGHGIFAVDGVEWLHQRKVASQMFNMCVMRESTVHAIASHLKPLQRVLAQAANTQQPINLFRVLNRFTMEEFAEIAFGEKMNLLETEEEHPFQRAMDCAQEMILLRFLRPSWLWKLQRWLNIGAEAELKRAVGVMDTVILDVVRRVFERRAQRPSDPQHRLNSLTSCRCLWTTWTRSRTPNCVPRSKTIRSSSATSRSTSYSLVETRRRRDSVGCLWNWPTRHTSHTGCVTSSRALCRLARTPRSRWLTYNSSCTWKQW